MNKEIYTVYFRSGNKIEYDNFEVSRLSEAKARFCAKHGNCSIISVSTLENENMRRRFAETLNSMFDEKGA